MIWQFQTEAGHFDSPTLRKGLEQMSDFYAEHCDGYCDELIDCWCDTDMGKEYILNSKQLEKLNKRLEDLTIKNKEIFDRMAGQLDY